MHFFFAKVRIMYNKTEIKAVEEVVGVPQNSYNSDISLIDVLPDDIVVKIFYYTSLTAKVNFSLGNTYLSYLYAKEAGSSDYNDFWIRVKKLPSDFKKLILELRGYELSLIEEVRKRRKNNDWSSHSKDVRKFFTNAWGLIMLKKGLINFDQAIEIEDKLKGLLSYDGLSIVEILKFEKIKLLTKYQMPIQS